MTIREIQQQIATALNGVEALVQGGCKAFAEDSNTVLFDVQTALQAGNVCIVVVTPDAERNGGSPDGIPVGLKVAVQCSEIPDLNRAEEGHLTALDAAEIVAHELDSVTMCLLSVKQWADAGTRTVTATAEFATTMLLERQQQASTPQESCS